MSPALPSPALSYETPLARARDNLRLALSRLQAELRAYPTPVPGCDAQYNHLLGQRTAISTALRALETPPSVETSSSIETSSPGETPHARQPGAGTASSLS